ncbi:MAG TPA: threonine ammonia-lyase, partial [Thermoanaerobaculia bacterium]
EDEIRAAVIRLLETGKTSAEGAAAATLAALTRHRIPAAAGRHVVMILSGANIDIAMLSRIIDRFMVESHRLVRFRTHVPDRPGGLAEMLQVLSCHGANVKAIQHDRVFMHAGFWEAQVDAIIETRNADHIEELRRALRQHGYAVERLE